MLTDGEPRADEVVKIPGQCRPFEVGVYRFSTEAPNPSHHSRQSTIAYRYHDRLGVGTLFEHGAMNEKGAGTIKLAFTSM